MCLSKNLGWSLQCVWDCHRETICKRGLMMCFQKAKVVFKWQWKQVEEETVPCRIWWTAVAMQGGGWKQPPRAGEMVKWHHSFKQAGYVTKSHPKKVHVCDRAQRSQEGSEKYMVITVLLELQLQNLWSPWKHLNFAKSKHLEEKNVLLAFADHLNRIVSFINNSPVFLSLTSNLSTMHVVVKKMSSDSNWLEPT